MTGGRRAKKREFSKTIISTCLLYTSDAADEL